jgi:hypothetical protein
MEDLPGSIRPAGRDRILPRRVALKRARSRFVPVPLSGNVASRPEREDEPVKREGEGVVTGFAVDALGR